MGKSLTLGPLAVSPLPAKDTDCSDLLSLDTSLRSRSAAATLAAMAPYRQELHVLELIEHTLKGIPSIPIYEAVRQSSPAGYFCLGKGFSHEASMASALMEAAEMDLVEHPRVDVAVQLGELPVDAAIARPGWLEPKARAVWEHPLDPRTPMLPGVSLIDGRPLHVPDVDLFYKPGWVGSKHGPSTNGLASGNTWNEALVHGLSELLERDAMHRWMLRSIFFPPELIPLEDPPLWDVNLQNRINLLLSDGLHIVITRLPCNHPLAVMEVQLLRPLADGRVLAFSGWGCHASGLIATNRAVAESVQVLAMHVAVRDGRLPSSRLPGTTEQQRLRGQAIGHRSSFERQFNTMLIGMVPRLWSLRSGRDHVFPAAPKYRSAEELLSLMRCQELGHAFMVQVSPGDWPMVALRTVAPALRSPAGL